MNSIKRMEEMCAKYIDDPDYVFKMCNDEWLVVMKKLPTTITNESRKAINIINSANSAMFRADRLMVVDIINANNFSRTSTVYSYFYKLLTRYTINEIVMSDAFDGDLDLVCSHGIHYFKTVARTMYYRHTARNYTGPWIRWNENGCKIVETNYVDGCETGFFTSWSDDGIKQAEGSVINGVMTGKWTERYPGGHLFPGGVYINGNRFNDMQWCDTNYRI